MSTKNLRPFLQAGLRGPHGDDADETGELEEPRTFLIVVLSSPMAAQPRCLTAQPLSTDRMAPLTAREASDASHSTA